MPDIFGLEPTDYRSLQDMREIGILDDHVAQLKQRNLTHNFDALQVRPRLNLNDLEANAQSLEILTNNFQAIQAFQEEILYSQFRLDRLMPIKTNIPEGAKSYSYKVLNKYGEGRFIDNDGRGAKSASVSLQNIPYNIELAGIIAAWTFQDLRNASFAGIALDTENLDAAMVGALSHIEQVGISGDTAREFNGLINHSDITIANSAKTFANMTADEKVAWVQGYIITIITNSEEIMGTQIKTGLTLYLPLLQETQLMDTKYVDNDGATTVGQYIKKNNLWYRMTGEELKIETIAELSTADAGGTGPRALFGFNNDRIMEFAMPISPRTIHLLPVSYGMEAPMEYTISGCNMKRASTCIYVDDI